jgi:hypothetical protein
MRRNHYLSVNIATMVLAFLLWQAEVKAETKKDPDVKNEDRAEGENERELAKGVVKHKQLQSRASRTAMRQRALTYEPVIAAAAAKYKVDPRALWTIAYLETRFRANQTSPKGARGLMQMMPGTGVRFNLRNPYDAGQSINAAAQYVALLSEQFNGRLDLVLAAYNSGEATVDCYLTGKTIRTRAGKLINPRGLKTTGIAPYRETEAYVRRGMLVYARITSASIFGAELMASVRRLTVPAIPATAAEVASVNSDLSELSGVPAVLNQIRSISPAVLASAASSSAKVEQGFTTVFFDVHSGARYLVKSGEIVKPLEPVSDAYVDESRKELTKSVYFGGRE